MKNSLRFTEKRREFFTEGYKRKIRRNLLTLYIYIIYIIVLCQERKRMGEM